jgi:hypothetical protein
MGHPLATGLGFLASAALKAGIMTTIAKTAPNRWVDVALTGLIIGAGSKPVHDALSQIQSTKSSKEAGATTAKQGTGSLTDALGIGG